MLNQPILLNNWIKARETALARVCALLKISGEEAEAFLHHPAPGAAQYALYRWAAGALSLEGQELLVALTMAPYVALIDDHPAG